MSLNYSFVQPKVKTSLTDINDKKEERQLVLTVKMPEPTNL